MAGIFELFTDDHAELRFRLLAPDGTVLATSEAYPDKFSAAAAITDVRECAGTGLIQDHSAATPKTAGLRGQDRPNAPPAWSAHEQVSTPSSMPPSEMDSRLQDLVLDNHEIGQFLAGLAGLAATGLSHADPEMSCGITVRQPKKPVALAGSELGAKSLEELHNIIGEGPNLTAMAEQRTVLAANLENERQWPRFVGSAFRHGIRSILCVPLSVEGETRAALTLYARCPNAFSPEEIDSAQAFASQAARTLGLVLHIAHLKDTRAALAHGANIYTAQGGVTGQSWRNHADLTTWKGLEHQRRESRGTQRPPSSPPSRATKPDTRTFMLLARHWHRSTESALNRCAAGLSKPSGVVSQSCPDMPHTAQLANV